MSKPSIRWVLSSIPSCFLISSISQNAFFFNVKSVHDPFRLCCFSSFTPVVAIITKLSLYAATIVQRGTSQIAANDSIIKSKSTFVSIIL